MLYKALNAPLTVHLEIDTECNQICRHCYNFWRARQPRLRIRLSEPLSIRMADQLQKYNVFHVILTGGEPFMNAKIMFLLMDELTKRSITFSLNSNVTLLTPELAAIARQKGLYSVLTSFLSYDPAMHNFLSSTKGSFDRTIRGIKIAQDAGLNVAANMVVSRYNLSHVQRTGMFLGELGITTFSATRVIPPRQCDAALLEELTLGNDDIRSIVSQLLFLKEQGTHIDSLVPYPACFFDSKESWAPFRSRTCSAGKTSVVLAANGMVRACPHHEKEYGSLQLEELGTIWSHMDEWRDGSQLPNICKSCSLFAACGGGCRMASRDGSVCGDDVIADAQKQKIDISRPSSPITLAGSTQLRVRTKCRFRKDEVMGVINTEGLQNTLVATETLEVFKGIHDEGSTFTPDSLRTTHSIIMPEEQYLNRYNLCFIISNK